MCFVLLIGLVVYFFFTSRRRHTSCALGTGVQTCALPISLRRHLAVRAYQSGTGLLGGEERERSLRRLPSKITSRRGPEARASHVSSWPCFIDRKSVV